MQKVDARREDPTARPERRLVTRFLNAPTDKIRIQNVAVCRALAPGGYKVERGSGVRVAVGSAATVARSFESRRLPSILRPD